MGRGQGHLCDLSAEGSGAAGETLTGEDTPDDRMIVLFLEVSFRLLGYEFNTHCESLFHKYQHVVIL